MKSCVTWIHDQWVTLAIASTPEERKHGLAGMGRLPPDSGMIFAWTDVERPASIAFWMEGTPISLDIAFLTPDGVIDQIARMWVGDRTVVRSHSGCRYAIEMNAGWFEEHRVIPGDRVDLGPVLREIGLEIDDKG